MNFFTRVFWRFFSRKQRTILSAAIVIMVTVFVSRLLGLFRDRLLATYFSIDQLDIYFSAFRIPNLLFELLVMGAISTAFIPVFTRYLVKDDQKEAFFVATNMINISVVIVLFLSIPLFFFTEQVSAILVPGFDVESRQYMIMLTRIMIVGQVIPLIIGNFFTGMLQSLQLFIVPAFAPIVYNIGIIVAIILLSSQYGLYAPVIGVVIGAILYVCIQLPLLYRLGYRYKMVFDFSHKGVREIGRLMLPRSFGMAVSQIDTTVDLMLASFLGSGSITIFYFAQHLQQLPLGLFGATFAQASLPPLSAEAAKKNWDGFKKLLLASMHQILFFMLPASMLLTILRTPIVRLVFGAARFDWRSTNLTGQTLSFFAISLVAQGLVQLFVRAFYALEDTKTPVIIGVLSVFINSVLSVVFVSVLKLPVWSLAISTSIANIVNVLCLFFILIFRIHGISFKEFFIPPLKMFIASAVMCVFIYIPLKLFDTLVFDTSQVFELLMLTGTAVFCGMTVYVFMAWLFDISEVTALFMLLQKIRQAPRMFFGQSGELVNGEKEGMG